MDCLSLPPPPAQDHYWKVCYLDQLQHHILARTDSPWGHLICKWHEKKSNGKQLVHTYAFCIDRQEWGLYLDCRPVKIFAKCLAQLIARPFHIAVKTIYHLSMIPIFYEIAQTYRGLQSKQECLKNSMRSLADIIRTPLYGLAMIVTSIAMLVISPFAPESLFTGRMLLGKIEQKACWDEIHTPWTLAKCFQPFSMSSLDHYGHRDYSEDTIYTSDDPLEKQLTNFARKRILFLRKNGDLFSCQDLDEQTAYTSPVLKNTPPSLLVLQLAG
jgi:hypothetical protein